MKTAIDQKSRDLAGLWQVQEDLAAKATKTKAVMKAKDMAGKVLEDKVTSKTDELEELRQNVTQKAGETEMLWNRIAQRQMESKKRKRGE